jgi:RecB family endonuclease NucS
VGKTKAEEIRRVFREPYEDVDSESEIEDAIEKKPSLLFPGTVTLVARQHRLRLEDGTQGVIDMLFLDRQNEALYIVEIKKSPTTLMDYRQIKAYMQAAGNSDLMRRHLQAGASLRGILASIARSNFRPPTESVQVHTIDKRKVLEVLRKMQ